MRPRILSAVSDWADPLWLAEAHAWIHKELARLDAAAAGPIEQPHVRPWSTVLCVPMRSGAVWFKASIPALAHEAAVVGVLAGRRPDCVPQLLATDLARGWMLMADGGVRLRETIERERDLRRWLDVLPRYAGLQIDAADDAEELVTLGLPDRRLAVLPGQYEQLLDQVAGLTAAERRRLRSLVPRVGEMCEELAGHGLPETIQHDDLHDGQVFVRDDGYLFFDWGDACVSHPFFTLSVTLEGQIAWGLDDVEGSVDVSPFRDAYLHPFTRFAPAADLKAACTTAIRLGWVCRALNVQRFASALEPPARDEHLAGAGLRLRMFLAVAAG